MKEPMKGSSVHKINDEIGAEKKKRNSNSFFNCAHKLKKENFVTRLLTDQTQFNHVRVYVDLCVVLCS